MKGEGRLGGSARWSHGVISPVAMVRAGLAFFFDISYFAARSHLAVASDNASASQGVEAEKPNETHTVLRVRLSGHEQTLCRICRASCRAPCCYYRRAQSKATLRIARTFRQMPTDSSVWIFRSRDNAAACWVVAIGRARTAAILEASLFGRTSGGPRSEIGR